MKATIWAINGLFVGILFVALVGVLSVQTIGLKAGAIFNLNNEMVLIVGPTEPVMPLLGLAALSGLVMYLLTVMMRNRLKSSRVVMTATFCLTVTALVIVGVSLSAARGIDPDLPLGIPTGANGWLELGAVNPAVHTVLVFAIGSIWAYHYPHPPKTKDDKSAPGEQSLSKSDAKAASSGASYS
ncbi:MAG: hypothetical protein ACTHXA_10930 [Gulosibacter sp.]|uniref:hypothetical protein n=1 Tax=Gulosibacter sp. TaxID=2817531 RepID=UPI003F90C587